MGAIIPIGLDLYFLLSPSVRNNWLASIREHAVAQKFEQSTFSLAKLFHLLQTVLSVPEFWWALGSALLGMCFPRQKWIRIGFAVLSVLYVLYRLLHLSGFQPVPGTYHRLVLAYIGLGVGGAIALASSVKWKRGMAPSIVLVLIGLAGVFAMGLTSVNRAIAMVWLVPSLLVVVVSVFMRFDSLKGLPRMGLAAMLGYLGLLASIFLYGNTYYDVSPKEATYEVSVPPFTGIKTSPRRGFLAEQIASAVSGKKLALAYVFLPGTFLFDKIRSSSDTLILSHQNSREMAQGFLRRMHERKRYPEVIIETKFSPWTWGLEDQGLYFQGPIHYSPDDPFILFRKCASGEPVLKLPEFEVYLPHADKIETCLLKIL